MKYADAVDLPIAVQIGGREVLLKPLTQRDYLPWIAEITKARRETDLASIPPTIKAADRFELVRRINMNETTPAEMTAIVYTASGAIRVLEIALSKAGVGSDEAKSFIDGQSVARNEALAVSVSGLFTQDQITGVQETSRPNVELPTASGDVVTG